MMINLRHAFERSERKKTAAEATLRQTKELLTETEKKNTDLTKQLQAFTEKDLDQNETIEELTRQKDVLVPASVMWW